MHPLHPHDPPTVGPFHLLGRLGEDLEVRRYLAEAEDGSKVTLSVARPDRATDPDFRASFARRIEAVRTADSPYLCPIMDAEPHGVVPWAASARPAGDSLAELWGRHDDTAPPPLVPLMRGLAQGLADLHAAGATYGPFGAADVRPTGRGMGFTGPVPVEVAGTTEAFGAAGTSEAARDVHSWAELITESAADSEGVPLRLRRLVEVCLDPNPGLRPSASDLVRMLDETGVWASPGRQGSQGKNPESRRGHSIRRWLPFIAGGLALAAVATAGLVLLRDRTEATDEGTEANADCGEASPFLPEGEEIPDAAEVSFATFSPDGDILAVQVIPHGVTLWDWREVAPTAFVTPHEDGYGQEDPLFTPEGCGLVTSLIYDSSEHDQTVVTYDLLTETTTDHIAREENESPLDSEAPSVTGDFVAVGPDGSLALFMESGETRIVEAKGTAPVTTLEAGHVLDSAFLDAERLATFDGRAITVWDTDTGESLHKVQPASENEFAPGPGENEIVYVQSGQVIRWDLAANAEVDSFTLPDHPGAADSFLYELTVDADNGRVFIAWQETLDESAGEYAIHNHLWDLDTGEDVLPDDVVFRRMALHPDGEVIAAVDTDSLVLLDPDDFEVVDTLIP